MINPNKLHNKNQNACSFLRRLCAIFYDTILLSSVLFFATFVLMPFLEGIAIDSNNLIYKIYLSRQNHHAYIAEIQIEKNGDPYTSLFPEKRIYTDQDSQPHSEVALKTT